MISVVIPVGPSEANKRWLHECLNSVMEQDAVHQVLIIDDQANLQYDAAAKTLYLGAHIYMGIDLWKTPWLSGVAHAFNFGVALAKYDLVFMLGSDDKLAPNCLQRCINTWLNNNKKDGYYWVTVRYLDDREYPIQELPCNAAMVTKGLWKLTGGFAPETASGAPDAALLSCLHKHRPDLLVGVATGDPLYLYRSHQETDTAKRANWQRVILSTRDILTESWKEK